MGILQSSGTLTDQIIDLTVSDEVRIEIDRYIANNGPYCTSGFDARFSNILYRCNLHYIIDNVNSPKLIKELIKINKQYNEKIKNNS